MEHQKIKELVSSYMDGELDAQRRAVVETHIAECSECRQEMEEMKALEEVLNRMTLKKPEKEVWESYWSMVFNRLERKIGWILLSIGGSILLFYGGYKLIEGMIVDSSIPIVLKIGILAFLAGIVVMLVSLIKEQAFVHKRERYKEVEK